MTQDEEWMSLALAQAGKARRLSAPNPAVGAVIVRDGRVIGCGHTQAVGGPHAEIMALRDAQAKGESVAGATMYVTLEPCSHYGRTPPCAKALIEHRLGRVVVAILDPNPLVAGRGVRMLTEAGISVTTGICENEAFNANVGFITRMTTGRPWVRLKCASTLDGRTALPDGRSQWITGNDAREENQWLRARSGAIVTGIGTVKADNPRMTVRLADQVRFPLRVVVDARLEIPLTAQILEGGNTLIVTACNDESKAQALKQKGVEIWYLPDEQNPERVDLGKMLDGLGEREVNEVHLEAGAGLNGAFLHQKLVDEIVLFMAPCFFGAGMPIAHVPLPQTPNDAHRWKVTELSQIGADLLVIMRR